MASGCYTTGLNLSEIARERPRICAVSYLNTVPLVWGMLHGEERSLVDLSFAVPSTCAERVVDGQADLGIIPVIETERHRLSWIRGTGIACRGVVRSIFVIAKKAFGHIRTLATDTGSRTSVELARIVLAHRYGSHPVLIPMAPDLNRMLDAADAALLIGDAALAVDPSELDYPCLDLGEEWAQLTGLPMVFAVWSGRREVVTRGYERLFESSCRFGLANLDRIIEEEAERRNFPEHLVHQYLTRNLVLLLGELEYQGMRTYLNYAKLLGMPVYEHSSAI